MSNINSTLSKQRFFTPCSFVFHLAYEGNNDWRVFFGNFHQFKFKHSLLNLGELRYSIWNFIIQNVQLKKIQVYLSKKC